MDIIRRDRISEFAQRHPNTKSSLERWYRLMKDGQFHSFQAVRSVFPHASQIGKLTVFNIAGNNARLIAAIVYEQQRVYIRHVLTHAEYDREKWKE